MSEFAFLALGLVLGIASGAAVIVISSARPPATSEIRLSVAPNAINRRRPSTLSEDALAATSEPARGGPADRYQDDVDELFAMPRGWPETRTIVRSPPLPTAGPGDRRWSAPWNDALAELGARTARTVAPSRVASDGGARLPLPASIVASYPAGGSFSLPPLIAVPITPEPDVAMAALRRAATATLERAYASAPLALEPVMATSGGGATSPPVARRATRGGRPVADSDGPCDEIERVAEERCTVARGARANAEAAREAVREAQRSYDERAARAQRAAIATEQGGMRVAKETAQLAFRRARAAATTRSEIEAAARDWLTEINRINQAARDAGVELQREKQAAAESLATLERLTVAADAASAAAEAAEATCQSALAAVADCREQLDRRDVAERQPGAEAAGHAAPVTASPPATIRRAPGDDADLLPLEAAFAATGANEPAILSLLRGERATLARVVDRLAGTDAAARRRWQLALAGLVDAIVATSIDSSILSFPADHPFWAGFSVAQSRDIAAALASLGFRFDGFGGWADDRVPSQRDLSLAVGYAGLDPMRIRRWPTEAETAELYREVRVAADEYLAGAARGLTLGELVTALGRRADGLTDIWNDWERIRPLLLAGA